MLELQNIITKFGYDYMKNNDVCYEGIKALKAITNCRTKVLGGHSDVCLDCGVLRISYNSCRNKNCPKCGNVKKEMWIEDRKVDLLPVRYFHTVFTVPHELNPLIINNPDVILKILFKTAYETIKALALNKKFLGAEIGTTMVLHTWGQNLSYHPHVHCIVPGGGLSPSGISFIKSGKNFFIPVKVMSKVFRAKFVEALKQAYYDKKLMFSGDCEEFEVENIFLKFKDSLFKKQWVVFCKKPFKESSHILQYLANYTHKIAISNNRLISMTDENIIFRYKDYSDNSRQKQMTLSSHEFIRRFLTHVLPSGFQKIRHYGILSNRNRNSKLEICKLLTKTPVIFKKAKVSVSDLILKLTGIDISCCKDCGGYFIRLKDFLPCTS